jgi:hypothetical protein
MNRAGLGEVRLLPGVRAAGQVCRFDAAGRTIR